MSVLGFISKFGIEYCDLPTMMWNAAFFLRFLGLDIDARNKNRIPMLFYILTIVSAGCYFYIYLVSMVWFVFWRCTETGDILAAMLVLSLGTASEIGPVKLIYTMFHAKKVREIASTSLACDALVVPGTRFHRNLRSTLRHVKRRAMLFWTLMMANGVVYVAKPFFMSGRHLMDDIFMYLGLEPMHESPNYEIALTLTIPAVMFACYSVVSVTAFIIINAGYVEAQMLAWSHELLHLWDDVNKQLTHRVLPLQVVNQVLKDDKTRETMKSKLIESRLKDIIKGHSRNLNLMRQIENVFKGAFALELLILIMGLIVELLGGLEKTYIEVPFSFIPVLVDCLTGQRLADASLFFERAVFHCNWENFDKSNMKLVLLMLQSSQKTMKLTAGGLTVLNFSCLMSVIRGIYTAYTTLKSYTISS